MLTKAETKQLQGVGGRQKFTDAQKDEALRWLIANADKGATMKSASEKFGMSTQTLASYRQAQLEQHGFVEAAE